MRNRGFFGGVAVEFGLIAPFLLLLLTGALDFGMAAFTWMEAQHAAQAGAQYAVRNGWDSAQISAVVATSTSSSDIAALPSPARFCACPGAAGLAEAACTATCPGGAAPGLYGKISAAISFTSLLPYPGLPRPVTLTGQAVVRLD